MPAWDNKRTRPVELGDEPPIAVGDGDPARYTRRGVSLRWLFGAMVTAVTSTALMGGALVAALDGRYVVSAEAATLGVAVQPRAQRAEKGDRVRPVYDAGIASRRVIEVPTVVRQGDQRIIGKRPYVVVDASLVLDPDKIGAVPQFTQKETPPETASSESTTDAIYDQSVDGEITVSVSTFPLGDAALFDEGIEIQEDVIERELRGITGGETALPTLPDEPVVDTDTAAVAPNLVVIPENVSELLKSADEDEDASSESELIELVQPGDTLRKILVGSGVSAEDIAAIDGILARVGVNTLKRGQTLRVAFQLDEEGGEATRSPSRFTIYEAGAHVVTVAATDGGEFVLGEAPTGPVPDVRDVVAPRNENLPSIYRGLYQTMVDQEIPGQVRELILQTFALDVDFNQSARSGDRLTVLYSATDADDAPLEVLYAGLVAGGVERKMYRYRSSDGTIDYFDEGGKTGDKFLLRKPVERGVYRSGFGMRRHPILRRSRMHAGVDYSAPRGTKIYAAGDGVIEIAGWKAGYGRYIQLEHRNGYETAYAHQSRFADGIRPGVRVKQGQIIGYVGSTGFSTGPHLHFEVRVNGRPVNPLKIRLRHGKELSGEPLVAFNAEVERIDALIAERREVARR